MQIYPRTQPNKDSVNKLVDNFLSKSSEIFNTVAPVSVKTVSVRNKSPWTGDPLVCSEKRQCRRAERKWRKTKQSSLRDL